MARKRKTDPAAPGADAEMPTAPKMGDNKPPLTDDELRTLAFQHRDAYAKALASKKIADSNLRNTCKLAKAELGEGAVEIIKDLIALEDPDGEAALRAKLKRQADAMRWAGLPLGAQIEMALTEPDRQPATERAFDEGKRQSLDNKPAQPPYDPSTPQYRAYLDGYHADQERRAGEIGRGNGEAQAAQ